ncbi:MAG: hypothetical protein JW927_11080 [Deltaproteobacteria bacterium]|nr:hypothetical protein [Deltaproteobacteria bacterium]
MYEKYSVPRLSDFSNKAMKKVVRRTGLTHWLTIYPPAIGVPCGIAGLLFNLPFLYLVPLGACFLSMMNIVINIFFKSDQISSNYINELNKKLKRHEEIIKQSLHDNLLKCMDIKGSEQYAIQGTEQFKRIQQKYQNVNELLKKKLDSGELTFGRFIGAAEQVYLSTLDNLKQVVNILQSAGSIDPEYINNRIKKLSVNHKNSTSERKELDALNKRLELRDEQFQKVETYLSNNEEAMTRMEETTAAIAMMRTEGNLAATDFETAIKQLHELAQRAQIYNNN